MMLMKKHSCPYLPTKLSVNEDESAHRATKQDEQDDNEATEHAAWLAGSSAAAQTGEDCQEGCHDQTDEDEEEIGGVGGVRVVQGGLDMLTNKGVLSIQQHIDGSTKQCTEAKLQ